jgi:hypothetical protein
VGPIQEVDLQVDFQMSSFFVGLIPSWLGVALAGIWPLLGWFGAGSGLVLGLAAAAFFSPMFKKELAWAAAVVGCFMIAFTMGVVNGEKRVRAQWAAAEKAAIELADKARRDAVRTVGGKPAKRVSNDRDIYNRDRK